MTVLARLVWERPYAATLAAAVLREINSKGCREFEQSHSIVENP
jgi:hypothetical protein